MPFCNSWFIGLHGYGRQLKGWLNSVAGGLVVEADFFGPLDLDDSVVVHDDLHNTKMERLDLPFDDGEPGGFIIRWTTDGGDGFESAGFAHDNFLDVLGCGLKRAILGNNAFQCRHGRFDLQVDGGGLRGFKSNVERHLPGFGGG